MAEGNEVSRSLEGPSGDFPLTDPHHERLCECGHTRSYHEEAQDIFDDLCGHYCTYDGCECMDFVPGDEE